MKSLRPILQGYRLYRRENAELKQRVAHLEQALRSLGAGGVDTVAGGVTKSNQVFTPEGSEHAYRVLMEQMNQGAVTLTPDGVVVYANRRFSDMLGLDMSRVMDKHIDSFVAANDRPILNKLLHGESCSELDLQTAQGLPLAAKVSFSRHRLSGIDAIYLVFTDLPLQSQHADAVALARQQIAGVIGIRMDVNQRATAIHFNELLTDAVIADLAKFGTPDSFLITDAQRRITCVSQAFETLFGYDRAELIGCSCSLLQGAKTSPDTVRAMREAFNEGQAFHGEVLNYRKDGTPLWIELTVTPVFNDTGGINQFIDVQRDITRQRQIKADLNLAAVVFEQGCEGFVITDAHCNILKVNSAFTDINGYAAAEVLGKNPRLLSSGRHDRAFYSEMWQKLATTGFWQGEIWNRRKDGTVYPEWLSIRVIRESTGEITNYLAAFTDITKLKADADRILQLAHYDSLTGLPNRSLLYERAAYTFKIAQRDEECVALMFIDIDRFKNINDTLGHMVGDDLLVALAQRFKSVVRDQDTLARIGGDEFVLMLPGTDGPGALRVARKLLESLQESFQIGVYELTASASLGIALFPQDGQSFESLAARADTAMYKAKAAGRNTFCVYTDNMQVSSARTLMLESALRRALEGGQFELYYQAQKSLRSRNLIGAEALLRWTHPELGPVSPGEFIPIAENCGLIVPIGEWVLRTALQQTKVWRDAGMTELVMAVNLSAVQFRREDLPEMVMGILQELAVPPSCLELELTESVASQDPQAAIRMMDQLHSLGVLLSIDDFGTGYSSLAYLKNFRVAKLKIDQSFVRNLLNDEEDRSIVKSIIGLAQSLGLRTIAEGVETQAQLDYLRASGCDEIQGYWLSRPLPAAQFKSFFVDYEAHRARP